MDTNQEMLDLMKQLEKQNRQQTRYAKLQCLFSFAALACCVVLLFAVIRVVPQIQQLAQQVEIVLTNLEVVTNEMASVDLAGMVTNVDNLVTSSQEGVAQAMKTINEIDIEVLNEAIEDLADVVAPLARFFNSF